MSLQERATSPNLPRIRFGSHPKFAQPDQICVWSQTRVLDGHLLDTSMTHQKLFDVHQTNQRKRHNPMKMLAKIQETTHKLSRFSWKLHELLLCYLNPHELSHFFQWSPFIILVSFLSYFPFMALAFNLSF